MCRKQNSQRCTSHETIYICWMSATLVWEITHIMWLQTLVLLWRVKCCNPDHAHCRGLKYIRWGLNTLVFILSGWGFFLCPLPLYNEINHKWKKESNLIRLNVCLARTTSFKTVQQMLNHVLLKKWSWNFFHFDWMFHLVLKNTLFWQYTVRKVTVLEIWHFKM